MTKTNTVLATIVKEKARVENSIEREGAIKKNVENTEAVLEHIAELVEANTPLYLRSSKVNKIFWGNLYDKNKHSFGNYC